MKNRSFFFIMPLLNLPADFPDLAGFKNTYTSWDMYPALRNHVFILCDKDKFSKAGLVKVQLQAHDTYLSTHDVGDLVLLVFELKEAFHEDLKVFNKGKYSKLSVRAKGLILSIFVSTVEGEVTKNFATLHPRDVKSLKFREELEDKIGQKLTGDFELISLPDPKKEQFNISDYVKLYEDTPNIKHLELK